MSEAVKEGREILGAARSLSSTYDEVPRAESAGSSAVVAGHAGSRFGGGLASSERESSVVESGNAGTAAPG